MMIGRRSVAVALAFLDRERSIGADGWRRDLLIERIREHNEIEAARGNIGEVFGNAYSTSNKQNCPQSYDAFYRDNRIAVSIQRALQALERGDLDAAERHCEQVERFVVRERERKAGKLLEGRPKKRDVDIPFLSLAEQHVVTERERAVLTPHVRDNGSPADPMIEAAP